MRACNRKWTSAGNLLVEDQLDLAALMEQALEDGGRVTHAYSVFDALGLLDTQRFDGAVLDVEPAMAWCSRWPIDWRNSAFPTCSSLRSMTSWCRCATAAQPLWPSRSTSTSCRKPSSRWGDACAPLPRIERQTLGLRQVWGYQLAQRTTAESRPIATSDAADVGRSVQSSRIDQ